MEALTKKFGPQGGALMQRVAGAGRQDGADFANWAWRANTVKGERWQGGEPGGMGHTASPWTDAVWRFPHLAVAERMCQAVNSTAWWAWVRADPVIRQQHEAQAGGALELPLGCCPAGHVLVALARRHGKSHEANQVLFIKRQVHPPVRSSLRAPGWCQLSATDKSAGLRAQACPGLAAHQGYLPALGQPSAQASLLSLCQS